MNSSSGVRLRMGNDPRLLVAVRSTVGFFAGRAGFGEQVALDVAGAAEEACRDTLRLLGPADPTLAVDVQSFADRLEVSIEHHGQAEPTAGLDTFVAGAVAGKGGVSGVSLMARVDRVQYHTEAGTSRMTLIKYLKKQ